MADNKHGEHHEEHVDESWLIPYADLLTLLLALFIVLFASSQIDQKKLDQMSESFKGAFTGGTGFFDYFGVVEPMKNPDETSQNREPDEITDPDAQQQNQQNTPAPSSSGNVEQENLKELKGKLDKYIEANGLNTQLETKLSDDFVMITIRDQALYASGSAVVKPEARELGKAISAILANYPDYEISVSGHTDNVPITSGSYNSNWDLSTARSLNFMKVLFDNSKVKPERFSSTGYGEFRPIASNDTVEGRAQNRRVEVSIFSRKAGKEITVTGH